MIFDFEGALKSGFEKGEIVDFLRKEAKSDINWQEIDELKAQAKKNNANLNENAFVFDYLQNGNFNFNSAPSKKEDTLALIKEKEKQYQNPSLWQSGLEALSGAVSNVTFGLTPSYQSPATTQNQKITNEIYKAAVATGIDAKDLSPKTNYEIAEEKGGYFDTFRLSNTKKANALLEEERLKRSALAKDFDELSPQEKQAFKGDLNAPARAWDYFFGEDVEQFENWKETKRAENLIADYQSAIDDINRLNTYHQNTNIYNTFFGKDPKLKEQYLKDVNTIANKVGFDGAEFKEDGELYLIKDEEAYKVNEEFFKNLPTTLDSIKSEMVLSLGGAMAGARSGASIGRLGGVAGAIAGGAIGAAGGAILDVLSNNAKLDRENNTKEIIAHALEAGSLSLAGDALALGLAKGGKPLLKKTKEIISKAADNLIAVGFVRNLPTQNLRAAQKILDNSYTPEEKEALFAFGEEFGGRLKSGEDSNTQKLIDALQKSNLPLKSSALKVLNAINKPTLRQRQLELIELIRADESGSSLAFLIEVANTSPKASKALGDILNATTYNLQKGLKELGMDNIEIRAIYENLKNKTKADYNDVMENVLGKIYDENYKTTIDSKNYLNFRKELEKSGILESDAMAFLKDVEANIYNPNGVEFKQLNNALKRLNAYTKSTNPNLNDYLKSAIRGFLKQDIQKGIDDIFSQNTQGYADSKRLFESALSDYATMKEIFKVKGIKSLMDSTKTKEEAQEAFVRYLKGQGESAKSNYEILTQNLPKEQKENLELGVIQQIFEKSISKGENELKVFDSVLFNKEIEGLKDKFTTKGAKDALELIGGFHRLFSNDGEIAYKLRPPKTGSKGLNSTIATSAEGATKQKMTSAIMDLLMRNLPELGIPFTSVKFNGINERIQGAALRYHLLSALNHSVNVEDFKKNLQKRNTPNNFNLPTRELLNSFLKQVDEVKAETLKDAENLRAREAESFEKQKMEAQFSTTNLSKEQIPNSLQDVRFRDTKVKETENDTITRNNHTDNTNNSNISNTNTLDSHLHTTPQGNERVMGDISTQSRVHREGGLRESQELSDIRFTDTKGKEHTLTKETQEQWLKTFGLENLEQSYIPKHSEEIKQALGGKEIRLQKGSLLKLVSQGREEFIPQIKAVLDEPEAILRDSDNSFLFIKHLKDEDYFVNVSIDKGEYAVSISNGIKESNNLKNKLDSGAKVLYQSPNASSNLQTLLQASRYSTNKIDNVDSTTNLSKSEVSSATLSPFARAEAEKQARLEIQAKEEAQRELQREARREEIKENQRILQEQKDAESGQSSLNRNLDLGEKIQTREVKAPLNSVTLGNNEVLELKYVVVKADDLKTNFEGNALQPRTQSNPAVIERIATQFKPNLMIGRGGFEDLPILAPDGQVIAGNHRVEGMKQFNEASRKRYENAIKENFGVELESDELLLRMPKDDLENQKLVSLAFVSNANTNRTFGDRVMASLGKYSKELETIPKYFESQSVDELSTKVAKALEKNGLLPNEEEANLALLGHLAKNSNGENIAKVLTKVYQSNDRETFTKIKDMFVKNAGEFHNLVNDIGEHGLKKLELRPYLLDSINATSQSLRGTRADNFKRLAEKIDNVLKTTTKEGRNDLIESDREFYKNLIGEILGASLAKFARQENPANALYEVLKNAKADLVEALEPTLFKEGKGIENADIYDLLELLISKGEPSEPTSAVIDMLPALREKEEAYNNFIKGSQREGTSHKPETKDLIKEANESGKSVRETEKLVQKNKELSKKVTSKLSKDELDNLPIATQDELRGFLESVEKKEYQNAPDVLKIATLNDELKSLLNHNNNANVFITKSTAGHISQNRKGQYNQALRMEEKLEIPQIINEAKTAYTGGGDGFVIPFADKINKDKMNLIVLNSDEKGNFLITTKKVNTNDFNEGVYKEARAGVEPATTTLQNAEQKPTEAISLAKPNPTTKDIIKQVKEQDLSVQETKEAMQDSIQATQDLTNLKQKLENASDEEKIEILKPYIQNQNQEYKAQSDKLLEIIQKKDYLPHEIQAKIDELSQNILYKHKTQEELRELAYHWLKSDIVEKISYFDNKRKANLKLLRDLEFDYEHLDIEGNKRRFYKNLESLEKKVIKDIDTSIKERNLTYDLSTKEGNAKVKEIFYKENPDDEQIELFERVLPIAQKLNVEVRHAINDEIISKEADGVYLIGANSARVKNNRITQSKSEVLLHELIHSVTSRAMIAYESGKRELLSPNQIVAINNIQNLHREALSKHKELGLEAYEKLEKGYRGDYGLKNSHEFVAELSNPIFREKLKKVGVFEKLVDNILRLFVSAKEALGLAKTNAYDSLKRSLYGIIDNYKDDFTANYEKQGIKELDIKQSKKLEKAFLDSDNINIEALEAEAVKLPKVLSFREFKEQFRTDAKGNAKVNTLIGEIKINVPKAYNHFVKNTYNVDRKEFSGAFLDTLVNPLFIVRQKYRPKVSLQGKSLQRSNNSLDSKIQNKSRIQIGDKEIIQDSYVFYKPFVNENGLVSLASFAISQNGELLHKTFYDIKTLSKLKKLIKGDDEDLLYFKNSKDLLNPQELKTISKIQKTYNFNEAKAKDLYEWHKDSNPITKDKNGLPKVFYHGSWKEFEVFQKELTRDYEMPQGSYFSSNKAVAKQYGETLYESFLKVKNPFIIENFGETFNDSRDYIIDKIANIDLSKYDSIILKNIKDNPNGSGGKLADTIIIFDSNQIKHIDNQGSYTDIQGNITKEKPKDKEAEHRYFNEKSPNIYYSNPHLGVGLASGSVAGIEEDENGNISFNAEKFVLGMLGGVGGSVSFAKSAKYLKDNPQYKELVAQELSNTLTKGWGSAKAKYPLLEALEPRYIIKNEKGRILQSKAILKELFIKEDRILEERLNSFAEPLPKALSKQEFLNQKNRGYNNINTPIGGIIINLEHAWEHMNKKNTYKKDRSMYSGAFLDTLTDPLFIVKQEYVPNPKLSANAREMQNSKLVQNKDNQSIAQDSYVFFKPYQLQEKYTYMVGYALDTNGEIINTTFIPMNKRDFGRIKKMLNSNVLYFKERKNDFQYFNEK